jgi:hypothetical protein
MMSATARFTLAAFSTAFLAEGYYLGSRTVVRLEARAATAGIRSELTSTDREIIVAVRIPGLRADTLNVAVDGALVTITCLAERRDYTRRYEMIMPLPASADAARHRVVQEGDAFKIIFETIRDGPLNF